MFAAASAIQRSNAFQSATSWRNYRPGLDPLGRIYDASKPCSGRSQSRPSSSLSSSSTSTDAFPSDLPTRAQLASEPFMKQVSYAAEIIPLLGDGGGEVGATARDDAQLTELLSAQLSHSDGIRGFFVSYLTVDGAAADADDVPVPLREAMAGADPKELVPLACMNLIMPTAMITMHEDPELSASSARTAKRGAKVLGAILNTDSGAAVQKNCAAIYSVATGDTEVGDANVAKDDKLEYWSEFCMKWGYGPKQLKDIAESVSEFR